MNLNDFSKFILAVIIATLVCPIPFAESLVEDLPQRMGLLNEYAGVMSGREQEQVESDLESLKSEWGLEVVILATVRDPYNNPTYLSNRIMEGWGLSHKKCLFLLFVQVGRGWEWRYRYGSAVMQLFKSDVLDQKLERLDRLVKRGEIAYAIRQSSDIIREDLSQRGKLQNDSGNGFGLSILVYPLLGVIAFVIGLFLLRLVRRRICFKCFHLLKVRESTPFGGSKFGGSKRVIYYCPHCGYRRVEVRDKDTNQ